MLAIGGPLNETRLYKLFMTCNNILYPNDILLYTVTVFPLYFLLAKNSLFYSTEKFKEYNGPAAHQRIRIASIAHRIYVYCNVIALDYFTVFFRFLFSATRGYETK